MTTIKFYKLSVGDTFDITGDYSRIIQFEKLSDGYAEETLTASTRWFNDEDNVYID